MYERQIDKTPQSLVKDGRPLFGTYAGHTERLDIRGVRHPYSSLPFPPIVTNLRIKSRLSYFFCVGDYAGCIDIFDAKVLGFAEVCFWNMATRQKFVYRCLMGPRKRLVPHKLTSAAAVCYRKSRYIRINWDRTHDRVSLIFTLRGNSREASSGAAVLSHFSAMPQSELTCVAPSPTMRRCSATYFCALPLHGSVTVNPPKQPPVTMPDADGTMLLEINRTYMRFKSQGEFITAVGTSGGHTVQVRLAATSQDAVDPDAYNSNVLFCDGTATPLPPVVITHPYGIMGAWIIQDTENMVDLTFTPLSDNLNRISVFVLRTQYHTIYGTLEGALLTQAGEKITLKAFPGIAKKYLIRL